MKMQPKSHNERYISMSQRSMNHKELDRLAVPTVSLNRHQAQLKQALLVASRPETTNLKQMWSKIVSKKKFIVSGATLGLIAVAALAFSLFGEPNQAAYAEQLTSQSLSSFDHLSTDQQQDLDMRINGNAQDELSAAKAAKDLQVLTYAEFQKLTPQVQQITVHAPGGGGGPTSLDPSSLKYLKYTDSQGATHIIGVDKNNMPTMIMVFRDQGGMQSGSVQVMGGAPAGASTMTVGGTAGPGGLPPEGATSCSTSSSGQVHCTTNGQTTSPNCQTLANGAVTCSASASGDSPPQAPAQ